MWTSDRGTSMADFWTAFFVMLAVGFIIGLAWRVRP